MIPKLGVLSPGVKMFQPANASLKLLKKAQSLCAATFTFAFNKDKLNSFSWVNF